MAHINTPNSALEDYTAQQKLESWLGVFGSASLRGGTHPGFVFKDKKHLVIEIREEEAELFREQLEEGHRGWFWEPKESRHGSHQA